MTRSATFMKLGNGWGVRVNGPTPELGELVEVRKRDGERKTVIVTKIVSETGNASVCEITDAPVQQAVRPDFEFTPTAEQVQALDLFKLGQSMAIEAGAGTGKTATLALLARSTAQRGQYIAFNKAIVKESKGKFPSNVSCNTAHSLAYHAIGKQFEGRLKANKRMKSTELAAILRLNPINVVKFDGERKQLGAAFLAGLVMKSIERFCQSADQEPTRRHVPRVEGLDAPVHEQHGLTTYPVNDEVAWTLEPVLKRAWKDLSMFSGALPFSHSCYLKLWHLSGPRIDADFILFDEAQDANPVMLDIVRQQIGHAQVVFVGDSQQQIYSFTGAINALQNVPADNRTFLTQSFRFGPAIADVANRCLTALRAELRLVGFDQIQSTVEPMDEPNAILCRTNAAAVREVLHYIRIEKRPYLVGGGKDIVSFAQAAERLMNGQRTDHPELACFDTWLEVQTYVDQDEQGSDLKLMVNLIDEFTVEVILDALGRMTSEAQADVVISTAHKAKGREWNTVRLAGDFKDTMEGEELRLLYVAVTRARRQLDISLVGYFNQEPAIAQAPAA